MSRGRDLRVRAMAAVSHGTSAKRWPMSTQRYAATSTLVVTGAILLTGGHDRMRPKGRTGAGQSRAARRRSRSRTARALSCGGPATARQAVMVPCPLHRCAKASLWKCPLCAMCGSMLILLGFSEIAHRGSKPHIAPRC
jgi:hypothetical protein